MKGVDGSSRAFQDLNLHAFDINLHQVQSRQGQGVDRQGRYGIHSIFPIVDRLANFLVVFFRSQFQTAKRRWREIIRHRHAHHTDD